MKVQVSKTMVKALNQYAKTIRAPFEFYYSSAPTDYYRAHICYDPFLNEYDFNFETGEFKYITVRYDCELCAIPQYLSTRELNKIFYRGDTAETFFKRVCDYVSI